MLYRLEIENFHSIRDPMVIDLRAAVNVPEDKERLAPLWKGSKERAPKVVAFYGPNASGKTNVLRALSFLKDFIESSFDWKTGLFLPYQPFNHLDYHSKPTRLAVYFSGPVDIGSQEGWQCQYFYEAIFINGQNNIQYVLSEKLFYYPKGSGRKIRLFERTEAGKLIAGRSFELSGFKTVLEKILRPCSSAISVLNQLNHPYSKLLWNAAKSIIGNIGLERRDLNNSEMTQYYLLQPDEINNQLQKIDLGIEKMEVLTESNQHKLIFHHQGLSGPMTLMFESHGTQLFLKTYPFIKVALERGGIAIIDEMDASIHPAILPEIIGWFHDPATNPHNAQLWMSCQNPSLLEELIKEEVFFCEKDASGGTSTYGLKDIQGVRRGDNFYRKYLSGAYGALPNLG